MVEEKKNEDEKAAATPKASAGAWWKSTVVEEKEQQTPAQPEEVKTGSGEENPPEQAAKKSPRKRSPKKAAATADEAPTAASGEEVAAVPKTPRKRAPRKKKETVVAEEAATVAATASAQGEEPAAAEHTADTTAPKPRARRQVEQELPTPESAAAHPIEAVSGADATAGPQEQREPVAEGEAPSPPSRPARKRPPRKKKPAAAPVEVAEEKIGEETVAAAESGPAGEPLVEPAGEHAAGEPTPAKRSPRKRSHRKKKSAGTGAASVASATLATEIPEQAETVAAVDEAEEGVAGSETAPEMTEGEAGQERKKRRPSRRSRGRRKGAAAKRAETTTAIEPEPEEEKEWRDRDLDDEEFEEEDEFEGARGRDRRDGFRFDDSEEDEDEGFGLADDEELDEEREKVVLKLLINAEEPEECRLALLANGRLESIHVSTINRAQTKNNIYKARIVAIEPNLQAAFVDYGTEKNGFLPFSEIHPEYYREDLSAEIRKLVESHHWKKLSITDVMEKGQDVLVQVVKEEVGKKGANMTTYLSLPGRSVVLMPGSDSSGISRKISGEERRAQLRTAMNSLEIPEGIGWIVRTAGVDIIREDLARDVGYLIRLWDEIKKKAQDLDGVGQVYEDHQSVLRFLREHFDPGIEEILVDDEDALEQVKEFVSLLPSKQRDVKVRLHKGSRPIFNQYSVEDQIESIYQPRVSLPSGGSIVIEPTEALVSIDVNSGSTSKGKNFDQSIYQANLEAASELARQLRLRDLGGLIVIDFIDMRNKKHIRDVERMVKVSMRRDKAKVDFSRISKFGLMQISRQKLGSPIEAGNYRVCQHCKGRGTVRSVETLALFYLRRIQTGASRKHIGRVECHFPLDVAQYLLNKKRHEIQEHETRYDTEIVIIADPAMGPTEHEIHLHKSEKEPAEKKQG